MTVLAMEKAIDKKGRTTIGRACCRAIDDASAGSPKKIFDAHIAPKASMKTDGWRGYWPLGKDWNMTKEKSDKGVGFPLLHTYIMNIKGWWLRGTHHKCGPQRLQNYLDGYHFRFNRRAFLNSAFDKLIGRMAEFEPVFYKMIKCDLNT